MDKELSAFARSRPIRIAFLVEENEQAEFVLDGIFSDCYGRWGGRFSLITPCTDGRISESYWQWLESYGPDIVYSYVTLSQIDVLELHERLSPSKYILHNFKEKSELRILDFKPSYDLNPLSSLSTLFRLARYGSTLGGDSTIKIINSWHTEEPSRFLACKIHGGWRMWCKPLK